VQVLHLVVSMSLVAIGQGLVMQMQRRARGVAAVA
jgi:hypothetical protein